MRVNSNFDEQQSPTTEGSVTVVEQSAIPWQVHDAASVASVISLLISIWVAWQLRIVSQHFRELILIPKAKTKVGGYLKNLDIQRKSKDWDACQKEAVKVLALSEHVYDIITTSSSGKKSVKDCIAASKVVVNSVSTSFQGGDLGRLILSVTKMKTHLDNTIEVKKWR